MKPLDSSVTRGLAQGAKIETCDNSGAKIVKLVSVKTYKGVKGRIPSAGVGDLVMVAVVKGKADIRKQVVPAVIVRQKRPYRRSDGSHIKFEDNAIVILKDNQGNPKGTTFKGPIAKEATKRWPGIAKVAKVVV